MAVPVAGSYRDGSVLDILVQSRREAKATKRFLAKLLKKPRRVPRVLVTDKPASYGVGHRQVDNATLMYANTPEATGMEQEITDRHKRKLRRRHEERAAAPLTPSTRPSLPPLTYIPLGEHPLRRFPQLLIGLALYGFSLSAMVRASLGVNPWSVLYEGLERHTSLSFGTISALLGVLVLLLWIPLKQRPTLGTVANIIVVAYSSDLGLLLIPQHLDFSARVGLLVGCVFLNGLSVAVYVGARFGPGPRDGLMTGASAATGRSIRLIRTLIEITVLGVGWLLGGSVGVGTVLYALTVGPITQFFLPWFAYRRSTEHAVEAAGPSEEANPTAPCGGLP
ncbi:DDE-type integrase/transposase/recombinase [Streptomyces inhibens]|uniref:membrane protein YczE n=1 Tax=Streptomyces inhibens TaxID=2293571 RepID=UPI003794A15F